MLSFLTIALLVYGTMHFYLLSKLWFAFPHSWGLTVAFVVAGIALTCSPLLVWLLEKQGWHRAMPMAAWASYTWMAFLFLFLCVGLLFDFGHMIAALLRLHWPVSASLTPWFVGAFALGLLVYGVFEARQVRIERIDIVTPKLASGRITLAQITDLHLGVIQGDRLLDRVITELHKLQPDIVVATGDIVDGQGDNLEALAKRFHAYSPPLGAFAVTGNHEYYAGLENSLRFLRHAGFSVLRGNAKRVGGIVVTGVDDPSVMKSMAKAGQGESTTFAEGATKDFTVLLKHQPVVDSSMPFDLQLSGHIHGGQIFPFGFLTWVSYKVHTGLTELADGRLLYVSRGTGTWGPPVRLFAPPEITLITITSAQSGSTGAP